MRRGARGQGPGSRQQLPSVLVQPAGGVVAHAGLAAVAAFVLYAATACRAVFSGDSPELAAAAAVWGVPHPPGYPLYMLLTALWVHVLPVASPAFAANLASAVHGAAAVGLVLVVVRLLGGGVYGSAFAAVTLALGRTFWGQAVAAEVYAFDLMLLGWAAVSLLALRFGYSWLKVFAAAVAVGFWLGHRPLNLLYLAPLLLLGSERGGWEGLRLRWSAVVVGLAVAALPWLYLPLASSRDPGIDVGDPESLGRFWAVVSCSPYARHLAGGADLAWRRLESAARDLPVEVGVAALAATLMLLAVLRRRNERRSPVLALAMLVVVNAVLAARYNVLDARMFFLPGFWALVVLGGLGVGRVRSLAGALACLAAALGLGAFNFGANNLVREQSMRRFADGLLESAPADGVLLAFGDTVAHGLWFAQEVEGARRDVVVVSLGHLSGWYVEQLEHRHPALPWPEWGDVDTPEVYMPRMLEALGRVRPIAFAMDPSPFLQLGPQAWWGARTVIPRGLAVEVLLKDPPPDRRELARVDAEFWTRHPELVDPPRPQADLESGLLHLQAAAAALRCADFVARQGRRSEAETLYRRVLGWDTAELEREAERAYASIGRTIPPLDLARWAREGLERVGRVTLPG